jgi:predicted alpha/beta-fold hydrolase
MMNWGFGVENNQLEFKPLIKSSYYQTVLASAFDFERQPLSTSEHVLLPDGDIISAEVSKPKEWKEGDHTVFLVHGLCGSHNSHYMKRIANKLLKMGVQAIRINLRGCGSGRGLARGIYHSGSSADVLEVIRHFHVKCPDSPKILAGFSLGANISLKLAGELGDEGSEYLEGLLAVSPPVDLMSSARLFTLPENQFYANYFVKLLVKEVEFRHKLFGLPPHGIPENVTLTTFDEIYTAPYAKFSSAFEYYYYSSSKRVIRNINLPTKILFAEDDPIINPNNLDEVILPKNVSVYKTKHGGHIGFLGLNIFKELRWMDKIVIDWIHDLMMQKKS